jgi:hypothetical protein
MDKFYEPELVALLPLYLCYITCKNKNYIPREINIIFKVLVPLVKAKQGISNYHLCMLVFHFIIQAYN